MQHRVKQVGIVQFVLAAALAAGPVAAVSAPVVPARAGGAAGEAGRGAILPQSGDPSLVWTAPVKVNRVTKPKRRPAKPRPKKVVQTVPLLSLRWGVLKRDEQMNAQPANPDTAFQIGDRLALKFQVNQDGYLYIIKNTEDADDQPLLFPDSRINDGKNFVKKDQEIVIPSNCPAEYNDAKGRCWFQVNDEKDELTLIFSRDLITDLPEKVKEARGAKVKKQGVIEIKRGSGQKLDRAKFDPYTVQITNLNRDDNEELITNIVITHVKTEN